MSFSSFTVKGYFCPVQKKKKKKKKQCSAGRRRTLRTSRTAITAITVKAYFCFVREWFFSKVLGVSRQSELWHLFCVKIYFSAKKIEKFVRKEIFVVKKSCWKGALVCRWSVKESFCTDNVAKSRACDFRRNFYDFVA